MLQERTCSNPEPKFGGKDCEGSWNKTAHCNYGPCPVHGGFSDWISETCSTTCGLGEMVQKRSCNNPIPLFGGRNCSGLWEQVVPCNLRPCPIDGGFSEWVDGACSVSCGSGTMLQKRTCSNPEPKFGGRYCQGSFNQTVSCQLDPCPIHGGFSDWHNGPCSVSCGTGSSVQTRDCSNPVPRFGGRSCHGILNQVVPCTLDPCPVHGGFNEWLNGTCSTTCGTGQLIQIRECSNPIPRFGGRNCEGVFTRLIPCEMDPCPVNGGFSDWDNGPCSVSCGAGRMVQTRTCSNPTPQNGGKDCQGESKQIVPCILDQCPVHGRFSEWTNGPCSVSCGKGKMVQTRTCSKPAPQHGGRDCVGATFQISECIRPECPSKLDDLSLLRH
ncbi:hypothetical protein TCAL_06305 [Tigriopus californicus]|uniref:Uncharacterized protein n=1 Tax=Tigriopus californicus TaxID=6832 RepID=A0A553PST2_TIGCA|nr:hypothetical protein TCAL_06305 [Tigriopus californicus]